MAKPYMIYICIVSGLNRSSCDFCGSLHNITPYIRWTSTSTSSNIMLSSFHGNPPTPSSEQLHIEGPAQHRLDQSRFGTSFDERTCEYIFVESVQPTHPYFWLLLQMSIFHFVASKYSTNIVYTSQCWPTFTWFASLFQSFLPLHLGGEAPASSHCRSRFRRWCNSVTRRFRMSPP